MTKQLLAMTVLVMTVTSPLLKSDQKEWVGKLTKVEEISRTVKRDKAEDIAKIESALSGVKLALIGENYQSATVQLQLLSKHCPEAIQPVLKLSEYLMGKLLKQSEAELKRKEKLYKEFAADLLKAKLPKDLDSWLAVLQKETKGSVVPMTIVDPYPWAGYGTRHVPSHDQYGTYANLRVLNTGYTSNYSHISYLQSQYSVAVQITVLWQNYLHAMQRKRYDVANEALKSLANQSVSFTHVPRSRILDLQIALDKIRVPTP